MNNTFFIDNKIYNDNIITESLKVFKDRFDISYQDGKIFINEKDQIELIFDEFMNYLIYLYVNNK